MQPDMNTKYDISQRKRGLYVKYSQNGPIKYCEIDISIEQNNNISGIIKKRHEKALVNFLSWNEGFKKTPLIRVFIY